MTSEEGFDVGEGNGCGFVNNYEIRMAYLVCIVGEDELYELCMSFENIDSQGCSLVLLVAAVNALKILPLFEIQ